MLELLELPQFSPMARGYVQRWLEQTPHGERATLSGWMSERWPDVRLLGLLSMADAGCRCFQNGFEPNRPAVITHETARRELGQHPVAILEAARFVPREGLLKGWRERECRALCELAAVPFNEAASMAPDAIRGLVAPAGTPPAVAKGLKIAASWLSDELERPEAPAVLMHRLAEARATLVHDVTTLDAGWLEALGLPGLGPPARESVAVHSRVTRVTGVDRALTGIVIGPGTITPELVAAQVTRAPGAVRLGFSNEAPLRLMNWWPGQSTAGIEGQRVTVIGPIRAESLRRLQLALPAQVTEIILLEPPQALTPLPDEPRAQP